MGFRARVFVALLVLAVAFSGCKDDKIPDTSGIKVDLKTYRFDKDLYAIDTNHIGEGLTKLAGKYPDFLNYFLDTVMAYELHGNYSDTAIGIREGLKPFLAFKDYKDLEDTIVKHYPDTKATDERLVSGFKLMKHYFPEYNEPRIIYLSMGLSKWPSFPLDSSTVCVALDMFLGDGFPHYAAIGLPEYMNKHMRESYIPVSVFTSIYRVGFPWEPQEKSLLQLMIEKGKEQYFLHMMLPSTPDSVLMGFSKPQTEWCEANEALIYNFFVQNKLLYNKIAMDIMSYVTDGPFARGLEPVSNPQKVTPGNIGTWLGYRIVASYMAQNPQVTLRDLLLQKKEPVQFLSDAKYKPR
jgi:hypothetical protein